MKNKRVLILGANKDYKSISKKVEKETGVSAKCTPFLDLQIFIKAGQIQIIWDGNDIKNFDFVWILSSWKNRQIAYLASQYLESNGTPHSKVEREKTKLVDTFQLAESGVNVPKSMFIGTKNIVKQLDSIDKFCGYPFLIKVTRGSLGKGIFIVNSRKEVYDVVKKLDPKKLYMIQEFIPNQFDYRVIISNGKPISIGKRTRIDDDFRNNAHLGANEDFMDSDDVPDKVLEIAKEAAKAVDLNWCGVDVVICSKTDTPYILEVNRRPGLTEKSTERLAAIKHFSKILSNQNFV
jgi:glutathione synthase/RimK-type ligase-like ATP-grasp enzyme